MRDQESIWDRSGSSRKKLGLTDGYPDERSKGAFGIRQQAILSQAGIARSEKTETQRQILAAYLSSGRWSVSFICQIERAWHEASRLQGNSIAATEHQAARSPSGKARRTGSPKEFRSLKRGLRQLGDLAGDIGKRRLNIDRSRRTQNRRRVDNSREGGRRRPAAVH